MSSQVVIKDKKHSGSYSRMATALQQMAGKIDTIPDGLLYDQKVTIEAGGVIITNDELDLEFEIPFDDDTEANEAEIVIYNLTDDTIRAIEEKAAISVSAGYGKDTGIIFSGYISKKKTYWEDNDKITIIYAIDNNGKEEKELTSLSFNSGTKASAILRKLVERVGLPVAVFATRRDHTYKDKVTVDGGLMQNIKKYAQICGVTAYVCKSKIYVCPLAYGTYDLFYMTADTGLLNTVEFEETNTAEDYTDHIIGQEIEMLLQHRVQTGSVINLSTKNVKGNFKVREGSHTYNGDEFKTKVKAIEFSCLAQ
ncbi:phage protein [Phascolarctobacterium sp.]|uniref:phage protein n=1 Tax=Phascolarctobacterium sp. TaxID=2049039 RepID=UPI00386A99D9